MTESEWLTSTDSLAMFRRIDPHQEGGVRMTHKLRHYLIALCRAEWERLPAACRAATNFAERHNDATRPDMAAQLAVLDALRAITSAFADPDLIDRCEQGLRAVGLEVPTGPPWRGTSDEWTRYTRLAAWPHLRSIPREPVIDHHPDLIRCIYGNPFRPVAFDPQWRTRTVTDLARSMYESRDFGPMPILADALEEAGCDSPDVLAHCRGESPHARGCWVVDAVLDKG